MNRKKLITYDDKTGEILHEKELKSWDGMDLVGYDEVTVDEVNEVMDSITRKKFRLLETIIHLKDAIRRSGHISLEEKIKIISRIDKL